MPQVRGLSREDCHAKGGLDARTTIVERRTLGSLVFPDMQQVYQRLDRSVRKLRGEMIDFTRELVAVASENPPGSKYREAVHVIESRLEQLGLS